MNGLAGLYCYFLGLSHQWMAEGGLAGWLIPSEFMDVNYGASVKRYLLDKVTLLHIHRFDPKKCNSGRSSVLCGSLVQQARASADHKVRMTYGGSLLRPSLERLVPVDTLRRDPKWTLYPVKESHSESQRRCSRTSSRLSAGWRRAATGTSSCQRRRSKSEGFLPRCSDLYFQARVTCQITNPG